MPLRLAPCLLAGFGRPTSGSIVPRCSVFGMTSVLLTTCQARNSAAVIESLAEYLSQAAGFDARMVLMDAPWEARAVELDAGRVDVSWICGQPYVRNTDDGSAAYELLAAPVRASSRYGDEPVYFSDVVVRADADARRFEDLRGVRVGYNEPESFSGYTVLKDRLTKAGEQRFFSSAIQIGTHEGAIEAVLAGTVDTATIDSTVLERAALDDPGLMERLRVIETLGPNPAPPLVLRKTLHPGVRDRLRDAVLSMHRDPAGVRALAAGMLSRFAAVNDRFYDPIRAAYQRSLSVELAV